MGWARQHRECQRAYGCGEEQRPGPSPSSPAMAQARWRATRGSTARQPVRIRPAMAAPATPRWLTLWTTRASVTPAPVHRGCVGESQSRRRSRWPPRSTHLGLACDRDWRDGPWHSGSDRPGAPDVLGDESLVTWRQDADHLYLADLPGVDGSRPCGQGRGSLTDSQDRCGAQKPPPDQRPPQPQHHGTTGTRDRA